MSGPALPASLEVASNSRRRVRHVSNTLGEVVEEDREDFMLKEINEVLKRDRAQIPDIWHIVKNKKLKKEAAMKKKKNRLDHPTSCNKFNLISKDRLELAIRACEPSVRETIVYSPLLRNPLRRGQ